MSVQVEAGSAGVKVPVMSSADHVAGEEYEYVFFNVASSAKKLARSLIRNRTNRITIPASGVESMVLANTFL